MPSDEALTLDIYLSSSHYEVLYTLIAAFAVSVLVLIFWAMASTELSVDMERPISKDAVPSSSTLSERTGQKRDRPIRLMRPQPLPELNLRSTASFHVLTKTLALEIRNLVPSRLQARDWECIYSLDQHGVALSTLYSKLYEARDRGGERPGFVLVLKSSRGGLFGAYVNEYFRPASVYFGNGECFLFKTEELKDHGWRFKAYPWTGLNDYQIYCTNEFLSLGGGEGRYALWLNDRLESGISSTTTTFGNEPLCDINDELRTFELLAVEVWKIG